MRPILLAVLALCSSCTTESTTRRQVDPEALLRRYVENNQKPSPIVEYRGGLVEVLVYPDGLFMVADEGSAEGQPKSRWQAVNLSPTQLTNVLAGLCSKEGFWRLNERYVLARGYDLPRCYVRLRIPEHPEKTVGVVGWISAGSAPFVLKERVGTGKPPQEFVDFVGALTRIRPEGLHPWDPGYVEIEFSDYGNALGRPLKWPAEWPSLQSPLVRERWGSKTMIFPSELVIELDAFLAKRTDHTAVLIDDWKTSVGYRWPLPAEMKQTTLK
jgi:hypothetical protein